MVMIAKKLEALRFYFKLYGFKGGITFALGLVRHPSIYIFAVDLTKNFAHLENLINPELNFLLITDAAGFDSIMKDYASIKGKSLALQDKQRVVSGKEYLGVVYKHDQFAGWGWVKKGPLKFGNCQLTDYDCAIVKCRTLRSQRRQGVYATLLVRMQQALKAQGFQKAYIFAIPFNKASLGGIEKVGFEFVEECNRGSFVSRLIRHILGKEAKVPI
jgi:hypothetical protein